MLKTISSIVNAIGALNYKGTWNASTNTPTLASGVGTKGDYYVVSVAGSTNLDGETLWGVGDWAVFNGSIWQKVDGGSTGNFTSLNTGTLDVTGNSTLGDASTDTVTVNGYMGVGAAASTDSKLYIVGPATSGTNQYGVQVRASGTSGATGSVRAVYGRADTEAASFTTSAAVSFWSDDAIKGAGSTITNQHGVYISDQTQGTNNYGITSLVSSGANKWNIYASGTAANHFAGNVGIGTASPGARLDITSSAAFTARFSGPVNTYVEVTDGTGSFKAQLISNSPFLTSVGSYPMIFGTNNSERMRLTASGSLGVGTTSPNGIIHAEVASGNAVIRSKTGGSGSAILILETTGIGAQQINANTGSAQNLTMTVAGSERLRIDSSGNVGIGTISPSTKLHVVSDLATNSVLFTRAGYFELALQTTSTGGSDIYTKYTGPEANTDWLVGSKYVSGVARALNFVYNGTERMRLDSAGNLGLGVTPSAWSAGNFIALQVGKGASIVGRGGAGTEDQIYVSANAYNDGSWKYIGTGNATSYYQDNGEHVWRTAPSGTAGNAITFTQAMTLTASGNLGIGTASAITKLDVDGTSFFRNTQYINQPTPTAIAVNTTLSVAQILTQIITTSSGAITLTMPTGTTLDSGLPASFPNDGAFDFTIIDTDAGTTTLNGNTGVTIVGSGSVGANSSGTFRFRKTGTATYVVYRLA